MRRFLVILALRNVFRHTSRSALSLGTIAAGAAGLFLFTGFNTGMLRQYRQSTIHTRYGHGALYPKSYIGKAHVNPWSQWIDTAAVLPTLRAMPEVQGAYPRVSVMAFASKDASFVAQGEGVDGPAEASFFNQLNFVEGGDFTDAADGVVLGRGLAAGLDAHVGDEIDLSIKNTHNEVGLETTKVKGVFFTGVPAFDDVAFRVPLALAQHALGTDRVEDIVIELRSDAGWNAFAQKASVAFPDLDVVSFEKLDGFYDNAIAWLSAQFAFIRGIVLLVVFLGIFNIISLGVMERTGEIGALRANGDSKLEVAAGQLIEAGVVGFLGGAFGILFGYLIALTALSGGIQMPPAPGFTRGFRIYLYLTAPAGAKVLVLCMVTAIAGAVIPVWRATRIQIAAALRHD